MPRGMLIPRDLEVFEDEMERLIPILQFTPTRDWNFTMSRISKLGGEVKSASIKAQIRIGEDIIKRIRAHILIQDLPWKPLSYEYYKEKTNRGLDDRTYMAYGNYYRALDVWVVGNSNMVLAGVKRNKYTRTLDGKRKSKLELAAIGAMLEFGTARIPRRPLWNATLKELGNTQGIRDLFIKHFINIARSHGVPINNLKSDLGWK